MKQTHNLPKGPLYRQSEQLLTPTNPVTLAPPLALPTTKTKTPTWLVFSLAFFIGAAGGMVVETAWGVIKLGVLERRSGLLFLPMFNPIYGAGAVVLTLLGIHKGATVNKLRVFLLAVASGTAVEYIMSWIQEFATGSISWDYSGVPLNIAGRVNLLYSIAWGLLGLLWVTFALPRITSLARKLDTLMVRRIMIALIVLTSVDICLSGVALMRWSQRKEGTAPITTLGTIIDTQFPDARMRAYYPNHRFIAPSSP